MATPAFPFAAVILAPRAAAKDRPALTRLVEASRATGADPVIVAAPREMAPMAGARSVHVAGGASDVTALRIGMAQLGNSSARYVLLLRLGAAAHDVVSLLALVDAAKRSASAVSALDGDDIEQGPVIIARDAWLELMTLADQGIAAVAARRGVQRVRR
ncbi:MAG TPA: hypothetical protein VGG84_06590 [Gemmatimonadaceae bacterium]